MRKCPKCSMEYDDDRKICRACGSALDDFLPPPPTEALPQTMVTEEPIIAEIAEVEKPRHSWKCSGCGQLVPGDFAVCWNCGDDEQGRPDPSFSVEPKDDWTELERKLVPETEEARINESQCPKCGSKKIIPGTRVCDQGESSNGNLQAVVYGDPDAFIFKDRLYGKLTADICGDCGHVELKVENSGELYDHYMWSKQNG